MMSVTLQSAAQSAADQPQALPEAPSADRASENPVSKTTSLPVVSSNPDPAAGTGTWNAPGENFRGTASGGFYLLERFAFDQKAIWASPLQLRRDDAEWGLPAAAGVGALIAADSWFAKQARAGEISRSRSLSNYGAFSLAGAAGGMFLCGKVTHNDHAAETGLLASEAAVNAAVVDYALKSMFERQRPYEGNGAGRFFAGGSSFPSEHAAVSWAIAGVVAHEYPGTFTRLLSYGVATAVTVARVTGTEHFPSDAVAGGALGYFVAQQIYRRRRDPEVSEAPWGSPVELHSGQEHKVRNPRNMGSSYVPLDSWVYSSIERLAALGYVQTAYLGMRPWSRMECARLLEEGQERMRYAGHAADRDDAADGESEAERIYTALETEFTEETGRLNGAPNVGVSADSFYTRLTGISGEPLRDGYHFGQTLVNDYGRPYGEGMNTVTGAATQAVAGPFAVFLRGEYQQAGPVPALSQSTLQAIASADIRSSGSTFVPRGFSLDTGSFNRFRLLEASVSVSLHNFQISFGKQSNWMGPGESGPLLMSNNAAPLTMLKLDNTSPFSLPVLSRFLGPARTEFFLGELSGANWVYQPPTLYGPNIHPQPFIHGTKIGFKPTPNFEFGMGLTVLFGGPGLPFTWDNFLRTFYSHKANLADDPGKRFSSFDFTYRVPRLRHWLTFYMDSLVDDEYSPIGSTRPSLNPGLYFPQLPKLPRIELRVEGLKTDHPTSACCFPGSVYWDLRYNSGYTNNGNLLGSWIGRAGYGGQAWATYSFSKAAKLQLGYRYQEVDRAFIGGGRLIDYSVRGDFRVSSVAGVTGFLQYERWDFPVLSPAAQGNVTASLQFTYHPHWQRK